MIIVKRLWLGFLFLYMVNKTATQIDKECRQPLGMQDKRIPDDHLTATSSHASTTGPQYARLRHEGGGGAWCAFGNVEPGAEDQYLQVRLPNASFISRIATQGRYDKGRGMEFVRNYKVNYSRDGATWFNWKNHKGVSILRGNSDTANVKIQSLYPRIAGVTYLRIIPVTSQSRPACLRLEFFGCLWKSGLLSYSIPTPDHPSSIFHMFSDDTYDGVKTSVSFHGGLGQLADGIIGRGDIDRTMSRISTNSSGYDYVGWFAGKKKTLKMTFRFDQVRNFSKIRFYCNTNKAVGASLFKLATVQASLDGRTYINVTRRATSGLIENGFTTRVVSISLRHILVRTLKIKLLLGKGRLLLSEVEFVNEVASSDYPWIEDVSKVKTTQTPVETPSKASTIGIVVGVLIGIAIVLFILVAWLCYKQRKSCKTLSPPSYTFHPRSNTSHQHVIFSHHIPTSDYSRSKQFANHEVEPGSTLRSNVYLEPINVTGRSPPPPYSMSDIPGCSRVDLPPRNNPPTTSHYAETDIFMSDFENQPLQGVTGSSVYAIPKLTPSPRLEKRSWKKKASDTLPNLHGTVLKPNCHSSENNALLLHQNTRLSDFPPEFPRKMLNMIEKLGEGQFGEVQLCLAGPSLRNISQKSGFFLPGKPETEVLVAVKALQENASDDTKENFLKEVRVMSRLHHPNIVRLLAVCIDTQPFAMITEYMEEGDLHQYLQKYEDVVSSTAEGKTIASEALLDIGTQIASGMNYLSSLKFVHRDLAARNCLVGSRNEIRIGDFGMSRNTYQRDYYRIQGKAILPIRWMAWECVLMGVFSSASDVWAFGVTMWEMYSLCKLHPYQSLEDEQIIENMHHMFRKSGNEVRLPRPKRCPASLFNLIRRCWGRDAQERPTFTQIHSYLEDRLKRETDSPKPKRPQMKAPEPKVD